MMDMWIRFVQSFEQVATMLTHGQAFAETSEAGAISDLPELAGRPAVTLYLPALYEYLATVRALPVLPLGPYVLKTEMALVAAGEEAILNTWAGLGLRPEGLGNRN